MPYEVEVKYRLAGATGIPSRASVLSRLDAFQPTSKGQVRQIDRYFNHPSRDFAQTDEALRLRWDGRRSLITYKGPKIDTETKTRREIELPVGSGEADLEEASQMLLLLGFREVATVSKSRDVFHTSWNKTDFEITIDQVDRVGEFVEIEATADADSLDVIRAAVLELANKLELVHLERRSYLELLLAENQQ